MQFPAHLFHREIDIQCDIYLLRHSGLLSLLARDILVILSRTTNIDLLKVVHMMDVLTYPVGY